MKTTMNPPTETYSHSLARKSPPTATYSQSLACNNPTCKTSLSNIPVWMTVCGHIFCDRCGTDCSSNLTCAMCRDTLGQCRIIRKKSINPVPVSKRLILVTGLSPDVVMETCAYAIQFYKNQTSDKVNILEDKVNILEEKVEKMKGKLESVKEYYEGVIKHFKTEISTLEARLASKSSDSSSTLYSTPSTKDGEGLDMIVGSVSDISPGEVGSYEWLGNDMGEDDSEFDVVKESNLCDFKSYPPFLGVEESKNPRLPILLSSSSNTFSSAPSSKEGDVLDMTVESVSDITPTEDGISEWLGNDLGEDDFGFDVDKESNVFDCESNSSFLNFCPNLESLGVEESENARRPLKLARTEVTEQKKVAVNDENVKFEKRSSVSDNLDETIPKTRSVRALPSNSKIPQVLDRLQSFSKPDTRYRGNLRHGIPYSRRMR